MSRTRPALWSTAATWCTALVEPDATGLVVGRRDVVDRAWPDEALAWF